MKHLGVLISILSFATVTMATEVDPAQSEFKWTGTKVTGKHYGKLPLKESKVTAEKNQVKGGEFVLDMTNVTVEDLTGEYETKFLTHMKSGDFFDVQKWPTAKLVVERMDGQKAYGKLTIKDKTENVEFPYKQNKNVFEGTLKFDRTKFGMVYNSSNFFKNLGDKAIYNEVVVDFKVTLKDAKTKLTTKN